MNFDADSEALEESLVVAKKRCVLGGQVVCKDETPLVVKECVESFGCLGLRKNGCSC